MSKPAVVALLVAGLGAGPAMADVVYLRNGEVFEDAVAVVEDDRLRLRLEIGELELPSEWLLRVERSDRGLRGFLDTRANLDRHRAEDAAAWLDLARTARAEGLERGYREALLVAADLDPGLEGLAPEMHRVDWVLDSEIGRWRPRPPVARVAQPPRPVAAPRADHRPPPRPRRQAAEAADGDAEVERTLARTLETLAEAELARARRDEGRRYTTVLVPASLPLVPVLAIAVGGWTSEEIVPATAVSRRPLDGPRIPGSLLGVGGGRQPGSLLPPTALRSGSRR